LDKYTALNGALQVPPLVALVYAITVMLRSGTVYSYIVLPPLASFHAWTAVVMLVAYFVAVHRLSFLPIPLRHIYAYSLMIAGMQLYESTYAVFAFATGHRYSVLPFFGLFIILNLLIFLDRKNLFLEPKRLNWGMLALLFGCYAALTIQGFFDVAYLYETAGGPDPNMNPVWLVSKFAGFMVFPFATIRGGETRVVRLNIDG
jgi:hypothetical protein